jgi:hypothetical protein
MPVKITKSTTQSKHQAAITNYTSGSPILPATDHISLYIDLAAIDQHRYMEVQNRLKELADYAREEDYGRPSAGTMFWLIGVNAAKSTIVRTGISGDIIEGKIAIGMNSSVRGSSIGSEIIDACIKELTEWANEQDRLTVY